MESIITYSTAFASSAFFLRYVANQENLNIFLRAFVITSGISSAISVTTGLMYKLFTANDNHLHSSEIKTPESEFFCDKDDFTPVEYSFETGNSYLINFMYDTKLSSVYILSIEEKSNAKFVTDKFMIGSTDEFTFDYSDNLLQIKSKNFICGVIRITKL